MATRKKYRKPEPALKWMGELGEGSMLLSIADDVLSAMAWADMHGAAFRLKSALHYAEGVKLFAKMGDKRLTERARIRYGEHAEQEFRQAADIAESV